MSDDSNPSPVHENLVRELFEEGRDGDPSVDAVAASGEERIRRILNDCGTGERHYRDIQSKYRQLASTWMLAALAGSGYTITRNELKIVPTAWMVAGIAVAGLVGISMLALLDLRVYHQLLKSHFTIARLIEERYRASLKIPLPHTIIYRLHRRAEGSVRLVNAYYGVQSVALIVIFMGAVAYGLRKEAHLSTSLAFLLALLASALLLAGCLRSARTALAIARRLRTEKRDEELRLRLREHDVRTVPTAEFESAWTVIAETGASGRHINELQSRYRQIASSWLLGTLTALVVLLTRYSNEASRTVPRWEVGLPVGGDTTFGPEFVAAAIVLMGCFGLLLLYALDLFLYQRILVGWSRAGSLLEERYPWIPPVRKQMVWSTRNRMARIAATFYVAPAALLIAVSAVFLLLDVFRGHSTAVLADGIRQGLATMMVGGAALVLARFARGPLRVKRGGVRRFISFRGIKAPMRPPQRTEDAFE